MYLQNVFKSEILLTNKLGKILAHFHGLKGSKIVLEADGCAVCDDDTLLWYAEQKSTFMLLEETEEWVSPGSNATLTAFSLLDDLNTSSQTLFTTIDNQQPSTSFGFAVPPNSPSTTLSMSSTALSSSSSTNMECAKFAENFAIPWEKFPPDVMDLLEKKQFLGKKINTVANIIVDEMRKQSLYLPLNIIRSISQKCASRYPESFIEKDIHGNPLSLTPVSLITTIKNRNNFLNRKPKRQNDTEPVIPLKQRRLAETLQKTCFNWQPCENITDDMEQKKQFLKDNFVKQKFSTEEEKLISDYMKECFQIQRRFFNDRENIPPVTSIQENWPFIFKKKYLYEHFFYLMNVQATNFEKKFIENRPKMVKFFKLDSANTADADIITAIASYFKEDVRVLFRFFKVSIRNLVLIC